MAASRTLNHGSYLLPWPAIATALLATGLFIAFGSAPPALVYDRDAIGGGELWRLVTGHLVHLDARHLWLNLAAFLLLAGSYNYLERANPARDRNLVRLLAAAMGGISLTLLVASPVTLYYCGISAVLNALFAAVTLRAWRRSGDVVWLLLFAGGAAKIAFEWHFGSLLSPSLAWPPHYGAHLAGLAIGSLEAMWLILRDDDRTATGRLGPANAA